ncbi:MAG: Gfo/Idh/MocA family oxidoreductase [Desulfovibrionaceae bacterium]
MLKVGVIGLGWMGRIHLRNYTEMPNVEVVGVVDPDPGARKAASENFGVATFENLEDFLALGPNAVSVCVPTVLHRDVALKVIAAGSNLLVEKPLAATATEGREIVEAARVAGLTLMVGHVERYNPAVCRIKELISEPGTEPISITIERVGPYPPRIQDVGVIKDLASHDIDLLRFLTGSEFKSVYAVTSTSIGKHEDTALITAQMENGVLANISTNWVTPYKSRKIQVACKSKYVEANLITQEVKEYSSFSSYDKSYSIREWPLIYREPVKEELKDFLGAVRGGTPAPIRGEDGLAVLETFDRIFECAC